tara:strand:+ start:166 stop:693 length:528 start_codon:yes stop_codon:yes gene_type:complete
MIIQDKKLVKWAKALDLNYNLDDMRVWARKLQLSKSGTVIPDYLGHDQIYWEDQIPEDFWNYLNSIIPLMSMYKEKGPRYCTLWEYQQSSKLIPHIDDFIQLFETSLVIPLIGGFRTSRVEPESENVLDSIEYGPGQAFFLKSQEYWHMGEPLDDYRLAILCFIEKGTDLESYIT